MLKSAVGVYTASGNILCDCHKIEQKVFRFVERCAGNRAKRPYQATFVELGDGSTVSLKELVDGAGGLHTNGPSRHIQPSDPANRTVPVHRMPHCLQAGNCLKAGKSHRRLEREEPARWCCMPLLAVIESNSAGVRR